MQTKVSASHRVFRKLNGRAFLDRRALEEVVCEEFNKQNKSRVGFSPGYTYRNLIEWGEQNGWIQNAGKRGYAIFFGSGK